MGCHRWPVLFIGSPSVPVRNLALTQKAFCASLVSPSRWGKKVKESLDPCARGGGQRPKMSIKKLKLIGDDYLRLLGLISVALCWWSKEETAGAIVTPPPPQ